MDAKIAETLLFATVQGYEKEGYHYVEWYASGEVVEDAKIFATIVECEDAILEKNYTMRQIGNTEIFVMSSFAGVSFANDFSNNVLLHFTVPQHVPESVAIQISGCNNILYGQFIIEPRDFIALLSEKLPCGYPDLAAFKFVDPASSVLAPTRVLEPAEIARRAARDKKCSLPYYSCMHRAVRVMIKNAPIPLPTDPDYESRLTETDALFDFERTLRRFLTKLM